MVGGMNETTFADVLTATYPPPRYTRRELAWLAADRATLKARSDAYDANLVANGLPVDPFAAFALVVAS